jgi:hypothetical protein
MIHGCTVAAYATLPEAMSARRDIKRLYHANTSCALCEKCDKYHVVAKVGQYPIHVQWKRVIELIAQGHDRNGIARSMSNEKVTITPFVVDHLVARILNHFYALNRANLVAIAISLGIIDPNSFVPKAEERLHA